MRYSHVALAISSMCLLSMPSEAVTLKNLDEQAVVVKVIKGGRRDDISLGHNQVYDTGRVDASFVLGNSRPVSAMEDDRLIVLDGRVVTDECVKYKSEQMAEDEARAKEDAAKKAAGN